MNPDELFKDGEPHTSRDKKIVCKDTRGRSQYIAINQRLKKTCRIHIDDHLIKTAVQRCDYGLWVEEGNRMILIELKGSDVDKAYEQLKTTHTFFCKNFQEHTFTYSFRIVPTRVTTPNLQTMVKMERKKGIDLKVHELKFEEKI